jgi:hypothetical protein
VIVVMMNTHMHLKFKVGIGHDTDEHSCSLEAKTLRCVSHQIIVEFASNFLNFLCVLFWCNNFCTPSAT